MTRFNLPVSAVKGHREFPGANTSCPGINMDTVRARLASGGVVHTSKPAPKVPAYKGDSIVDYLNMQGRDSSLTARKRLAAQYGIKNYTGTAAQNTQLLNKLRAGSVPKSKRINTDSIVDYLKATGQPSSFAHRKKLAEKYGIRNYKGTSVQNKKLMDILNR